MRGWHNRFSAEEDALVKRHYPNFEVLAVLLPGRTRDAVSHRAGRLGIQRKRGKRWTYQEDDVLRKHGLDRVKVRRLLPHRSPSAIALRCQSLGIITHTRSVWTDERVSVLKQLAGKLSDAELAGIFGTTKEAVAQKRYALDLNAAPYSQKSEVYPPVVLDILAKTAKAGLTLNSLTGRKGRGKLARDGVPRYQVVGDVVADLGGELYAEWED